MNDYEQWVAEEIRASVNEWSNSTERSEQAKQFRLGPSDMGYCSERVRRMLDQQEPEDEVDWNKAFIGTWLGDGLEQAIVKRWPHVQTQVTLAVTLEADDRTFVMEGHADVVDPKGLVLDFKAKNGLQYIRRTETADQSYQFQRHLYALGAWQSGLFDPDVALEDVKVGNAYYDRSGVEATPHVQIEPYDPNVVFEATEWLTEVVHAFLAGEEARKEPAREVCASTCGFFSKCRAYDSDVEGLIRDEKHLGAIEMYIEGTGLISQGKKMQNEAKIILRDVEGNTPTRNLRWVLVNGGPVSYTQEPYMRMSLTKRR